MGQAAGSRSQGKKLKPAVLPSAAPLPALSFVAMGQAAGSRSQGKKLKPAVLPSAAPLPALSFVAMGPAAGPAKVIKIPLPPLRVG
jgi:hypothetical protein